MQKSFTVKLWKLMKICGLQTLIAMILCGVTVAHSNYAQILDRKISINLTDVPFEDALKQIETAANIKFAYSISQLRNEAPVTIQAEQRLLRDILNDILTPRNIQYKAREREKAIALKKYTEGSNNGQSHIQVIKDDVPSAVIQVTGIVKDAATGQSMAGANVMVRGTIRGTTSDANGNFSIEANDGEVLVFSFIGYDPVEVKLAGQSHIEVELQEDITSLNEVVVNAGYWTVKKQEQTGSIVKVDSKVIAQQPVQNALSALQGRVPGLEIIQQTGVPGGNFQIRIRGTNSIANGNDPLIIIDGVPYNSKTMSFTETSVGILGGFGSNPLNAINPADIESIEILKDADATAIYGSRGSNGVILITTKKGEIGKIKFDLDVYSGVGHVERREKLLNTSEYIEMRREAFLNDNVVPTLSNARDLFSWDTTRYTNWQKELIGSTARTNDVQLSLSGGEKNTQFSIGVGYHKETTVFPGDNSDQRISSRINLTNTSPNKKLKSSVSINYSANFSDLLALDLTSRALSLPPNAPALYDNNGNVNWEGWSTSGAYENPVSYLHRRYEATTNNLIASMEIGYMIVDDVELKARFGYTNTDMKAINLTPVSSLAPVLGATAINTTRFSNSTFHNWIVEPQATWKPKTTFGNFNLLIGMQFLDQTTEGLAQTASGFSSEALMKNIAAAPNRTMASNYFTQYRYNAIFGRINFVHATKYILNVTARRDGSSRFGPGKQFANFGALGVAWVFSSEPFAKSIAHILSFGKLRASYGITGNDQLNDYQYLDAYTSSAGTYQGIIGLSPVRLSNPDFAWEENRKQEIALELGFADDRISTTIGYYRNVSSNQLVGTPLPPTTGFNTIQANLPAKVQNTGVELDFNSTNIQQGNFTWKTSVNVSIPRNKLLEFPGLEMSPVYASRYVVGEPLNITKVYYYIGVGPTTGLYQFEDTHEDGIINSEDRKTVKFIGQTLYGGFLNSFSFKGLQLDILFQFSRQTARNYIFTSDAPGLMFNKPQEVLDRWQKEGDDAGIQRFGQSSVTSATHRQLQESDRAVGDASYIRLKNLSISYSLPDKWRGKIRAEAIRVFIQGQNLLTFTSYEGFDPETPFNLPPLRVLTGGISFTF